MSNKISVEKKIAIAKSVVEDGLTTVQASQLYGVAKSTVCSYVAKYNSGESFEDMKTQYPMKFRYEAVKKVLKGENLVDVAIKLNISYASMKKWVDRYTNIVRNELEQEQANMEVVKKIMPIYIGSGAMMYGYKNVRKEQ